MVRICHGCPCHFLHATFATASVKPIIQMVTFIARYFPAFITHVSIRLSITYISFRQAICAWITLFVRSCGKGAPLYWSPSVEGHSSLGGTQRTIALFSTCRDPCTNIDFVIRLLGGTLPTLSFRGKKLISSILFLIQRDSSGVSYNMRRFKRPDLRMSKVMTTLSMTNKKTMIFCLSKYAINILFGHMNFIDTETLNTNPTPFRNLDHSRIGGAVLTYTMLLSIRS